jgi:hypothetical protein
MKTSQIKTQITIKQIKPQEIKNTIAHHKQLKQQQTQLQQLEQVLLQL